MPAEWSQLRIKVFCFDEFGETKMIKLGEMLKTCSRTISLEELESMERTIGHLLLDFELISVQCSSIDDASSLNREEIPFEMRLLPKEENSPFDVLKQYGSKIPDVNWPIAASTGDVPHFQSTIDGLVFLLPCKTYFYSDNQEIYNRKIRSLKNSCIAMSRLKRVPIRCLAFNPTKDDRVDEFGGLKTTVDGSNKLIIVPNQESQISFYLHTLMVDLSRDIVNIHKEWSSLMTDKTKVSRLPKYGEFTVIKRSEIMEHENIDASKAFENSESSPKSPENSNIKKKEALRDDSYVHSTDIEHSSKKNRKGRLLKALADVDLRIGRWENALNGYRAAVDLLKASNDHSFQAMTNETVILARFLSLFFGAAFQDDDFTELQSFVQVEMDKMFEDVLKSYDKSGNDFMKTCACIRYSWLLSDLYIYWSTPPENRKDLDLLFVLNRDWDPSSQIDDSEGKLFEMNNFMNDDYVISRERVCSWTMNCWSLGIENFSRRDQIWIAWQMSRIFRRIGYKRKFGFFMRQVALLLIPEIKLIRTSKETIFAEELTVFSGTITGNLEDLTIKDEDLDAKLIEVYHIKPPSCGIRELKVSKHGMEKLLKSFINSWRLSCFGYNVPLEFKQEVYESGNLSKRILDYTKNGWFSLQFEVLRNSILSAQAFMVEEVALEFISSLFRNLFINLSKYDQNSLILQTKDLLQNSNEYVSSNIIPLDKLPSFIPITCNDHSDNMDNLLRIRSFLSWEKILCSLTVSNAKAKNAENIKFIKKFTDQDENNGDNPFIYNPVRKSKAQSENSTNSTNEYDDAFASVDEDSWEYLVETGHFVESGERICLNLQFQNPFKREICIKNLCLVVGSDSASEDISMEVYGSEFDDQSPFSLKPGEIATKTFEISPKSCGILKIYGFVLEVIGRRWLEFIRFGRRGYPIRKEDGIATSIKSWSAFNIAVIKRQPSLRWINDGEKYSKMPLLVGEYRDFEANMEILPDSDLKIDFVGIGKMNFQFINAWKQESLSRIPGIEYHISMIDKILPVTTSLNATEYEEIEKENCLSVKLKAFGLPHCESCTFELEFAHRENNDGYFKKLIQHNFQFDIQESVVINSMQIFTQSQMETVSGITIVESNLSDSSDLKNAEIVYLNMEFHNRNFWNFDLSFKIRKLDPKFFSKNHEKFDPRLSSFFEDDTATEVTIEIAGNQKKTIALKLFKFNLESFFEHLKKSTPTTTDDNTRIFRIDFIPEDPVVDIPPIPTKIGSQFTVSKDEESENHIVLNNLYQRLKRKIRETLRESHPGAYKDENDDSVMFKFIDYIENYHPLSTSKVDDQLSELVEEARIIKGKAEISSYNERCKRLDFWYTHQLICRLFQKIEWSCNDKDMGIKRVGQLILNRPIMPELEGCNLLWNR